MKPDSLSTLANQPFEFEWNGQTHTVKKANLGQVALYSERLREYVKTGEGGSDQRLAAYAIWLTLHSQLPDLTEEQILEATPGDLDVIGTLTTLGFLFPKKETATPTVPSPTSVSSSAPSPTGQDGPQQK